MNNTSSKECAHILNSIPNEQKDAEQGLWGNISYDLNLETAQFETEDGPNIQTHLRHFALALHSIHTALTSGAKYRSKYFEDIRAVLNNNHHTHKYLQEFCTQLHGGKFGALDSEKMVRLLGHLSNLELKPLRRYFNDQKHRAGDYWNHERLTRIFDRWIRKQWRVSTEKDIKKGHGKEQDYFKLRKLWKEHNDGNSNSVVDFWLHIEPQYTIPPYQDNNNRRPPRCQSLILNFDYLNSIYPQWKEWLVALQKEKSVKEYLDGYIEELADTRSGSGQPYFGKASGYQRNPQEIQSRALQYILDRVRDSDPLMLNIIYSHAKKIRQVASQEDNNAHEQNEKAKLEIARAISKSALPDLLKNTPNYDTHALFPEKSFLHLVCKYYNLRQKARDGRIYIHKKIKGENTNNDQRHKAGDGQTYHRKRYNDQECLLTYCDHKPRQKRYQALFDVANLFQIHPDNLMTIIQEHNPHKDTNAKESSDEQLYEWFKNTKGLQTKLSTRCG